MKPLFRWTIGNVHPRGFSILQESIHCTISAFGKNTFDWLVCHNQLDTDQKDLLKTITKNTPVELHEQTWQDCPIASQNSSNRDSDDNFNLHGTMWKICPPRLREHGHEIIVDNDVVFFKYFKELDDFLKGSKPLVAEDHLQYYGRYSSLFGDNEKYNSGFIGLPPDFDFKSSIKKTWSENGEHSNLKADDEQGLITYSITRDNFILVDKTILIPLPSEDSFVHHVFNGKETGVHFLIANRNSSHYFWDEYNVFKNRPKYKLIKRTS